jgi:hypothetical protein
MKKFILSLAISALAPLAFSQTSVEVQGSVREDHRGGRIQTEHRERAQHRITGSSENHARQEIERRQDRDVQVQERQRVEPQPEYRRDTVTTHTEQRAENRGGKFFFRDRELRRRGDFDRNDWHFRIGRHDRDWYYTRYQTIVWIEGCWYYEDGGFLYPAYGFDPGCSYPDQYIVFTF